MRNSQMPTTTHDSQPSGGTATTTNIESNRESNLVLASVSEKALPAKCKPHTVAYCPTMDLVALATEDEQVHVYRLNGQRVFGGSYGNGNGDGDGSGGKEIVVNRLEWKENGRLFAVACSDNKIRLLSSFSGKMVHCLTSGPAPSASPSPPQQHSTSFSSSQGHSVIAETTASICCVGWGVNFTDGKGVLKDTHDADGRLTVDDLLSPETHLTKLAYLKADLPRELALLDIEGSLPKLSALPSTGDEDDVFSSRTSIDSIFHTVNKYSDDSVDVLLAGLDDGSIHIRIFDCFEIGSLNVHSALASPSSTITPLLHSSHPMSSTHSFIFKTDTELRLLTLDLRFITKSDRYLSLLASKITQLQNLLRYMKQVQNQIHLEWKNAQDIPGRYISNINEDLQEACMCDFVTAAYHLLVTGDCFEPLKEFLTDQVGERGHKRWDKAIHSGYETLRRLTHECLLPVLERCGVLFSRLIGLSKYHRISPVLGLETKDLNNCLATVDCLNLLSHKILIHSGQELREFGAFSRWLRYEIDLQSADPLSTTAEELMEKADTIDYGMTLNYVQGAMTHSALQDFIQAPSSEPSADRWADVEEDILFYDSYKRLLQQHDQEKAGEKPPLPMLDDLISRLTKQCDKVFEQIAETQRRGILYRSALTLGPDCDADTTDMTMDFSEFENEMLPSVYISSKSRKFSHIFYIYRIVLCSVNGVSATKTNLLATLDFQAGVIRDIKFVEDGTLMILWFFRGSWHLVNFPYISKNESPLFVNYAEINDGNEQASLPEQTTKFDLSDPDSHDGFVCHTFPRDPSSEPVHLEINGRKGRRVVCVLYSDGLRYSVFDIDSAEDWEEEEEEEEERENDDDGPIS